MDKWLCFENTFFQSAMSLTFINNNPVTFNAYLMCRLNRIKLCRTGQFAAFCKLSMIVRPELTKKITAKKLFLTFQLTRSKVFKQSQASLVAPATYALFTGLKKKRKQVFISWVNCQVKQNFLVLLNLTFELTECLNFYILFRCCASTLDDLKI